MSNSRYLEMYDDVAAFHKAHPEVWGLFVRFTRERIDMGFKHYSVNAIFERIRWESDVATDEGGSTFKLNNNFRAFLAASTELSMRPPTGSTPGTRRCSTR